MITEEEVAALRAELGDLNDKLETWRERLSLQEEVSFYAAALEAFGRRLAILEKKIAVQSNGQSVPIRVLPGAYNISELGSAKLEAAAA